MAQTSRKNLYRSLFYYLILLCDIDLSIRFFTYGVIVVLQVLRCVAVREHQKLRVAVESNIGREFAGNRCKVFR